MNIQSLAEQLAREQILHIRGAQKLVEYFALQGEDAVLLMLQELNRPVLSGEFMSLLGLSTGRIANILKQLESTGNISRSTDAHDRRRVWVRLTDAGTRRAEARRVALVASHERLLSRIENCDAEALARSLSCWENAAESEADAQREI